MNRAAITIVGKISQPPQHSTTQNGNTMLKFSVLVRPGVQDMEKKWVSNFYSITLFGKFAENVMPHVHEGDIISVTGTLSASAYKKNNGEPGINLRLENVTDITTPSMFEYNNRKAAQEDDDELPV